MTATAQPIALDKIPREGREESQLQIVMRRFLRHRLAVASLIFIIIMFIAALLAPVIAPFPRDAIDIAVTARPGPPGTVGSEGQLHPLGVDHLGRDLFTRLLYGARVSLSIAFIVVLLSEMMGVILGAIAGFLGGWFDTIISRTVEFLLSIPTLPILLITASILIRTDAQIPAPAFVTNGVAWMLAAPTQEANKVIVLMFILIVLGWTGAARLMRGMALTLRNQDFVEALRAVGASNARIMFRHIIPNGLAPILVNASLGLAGIVIAEATLSFLGVGVQEPTPSWGNMLSAAQSYMFQHPWLPLVPGIPLCLVTISFNFIGDGLRDALDPRLKR
ncbi:ABC transporter permease [Caldilinea sp.]|jgi:peptide/nickel transport system permease protein|uniref:ABC transporter permease n=1 Tax=Caldilinea sp. TaxID=2293560 RepID=UPI0026345628|nr:ABC transporter permease [uncultured Caldilinea sp.]